MNFLTSFKIEAAPLGATPKSPEWQQLCDSLAQLPQGQVLTFPKISDLLEEHRTRCLITVQLKRHKLYDSFRVRKNKITGCLFIGHKVELEVKR
jgi:hypothetical protein